MNSKDAFGFFAHLVTRRGFLSKGLAAGLAAAFVGCKKSDKGTTVSSAAIPPAPPVAPPRPTMAPSATTQTPSAPPPRPRVTVNIPPHSLAISKDGDVLAACQNGSVNLWSIKKRQPLDMPQARHLTGVQALAMAPDKRLACATGRTIAMLSESGRNYQMLKVPASEGDVRSVTFTPDGRLLASGSGDGTIRLWSMPDGKPLQALGNVGAAVNALAVTPDGKWLISGSGSDKDKGDVMLWSLPSGKAQGSLPGHEQGVTHLAVAPSGMRLVTASGTRMRIWTLAGAAQPNAVIDCASQVYHVGFLRGGKSLGGVVGDGTIHTWLVPSGTDLPPIPKPKQPLLAFTAVPGPKEQVVVAIDMHGTAWLGDAEKGIWQELEQTHTGSV